MLQNGTALFEAEGAVAREGIEYEKEEHMELTSMPGFEGLLEATAELRAISGLMEEASDQIPDSVDVEDDTGKVRLTMLRDGSIDDIEILGGWRDAIGAERFGEVVTSLVRFASAAFFQEMSDYLDEHLDEALGNGRAPTGRSAVEEEAGRIQDEASRIVRAAYEQGPVLPEDAFENADRYAELVRERCGEAVDEQHSWSDEDVEADVEDVEDVACDCVDGKITRVRVNPEWARKSPIVTIRNRMLEEFDSVGGSEDSWFSGGSADDLQSQGRQVVLDMIQVLHSISVKQ